MLTPSPFPDEFDVSHKHDNLLRAIFTTRSAPNIHWREVESL